MQRKERNMKIKELTDKQDKRLSYISQHSKSKRIKINYKYKSDSNFDYKIYII